MLKSLKMGQTHNDNLRVPQVSILGPGFFA
jgi:hypothetical protein